MASRVHRRWSATLPFLVLAYPVTFLLYEGGPFCGPVCFAPTPGGVAGVFGVLLLAGLLAVAITAGLRRAWPVDHRPRLGQLAAPPRPARAVLLGVFGAFVAFLTLDALTLYEAVWKPVVLPLSLLLFAPVWGLYVATFPLAILFSILGIGHAPGITLVVRALVLVVGFPLSAMLQTAVVSPLVEGSRPTEA